MPFLIVVAVTYFMALERRTCVLKVTSEIYVYNNNNIGYYIGYYIRYSDDIEVFPFYIVRKLLISYLDIRTPILAILRYRVTISSTIS